MVELPEFDPRYLQPLIRGACDGLRSESHLVTCERQWLARSNDPSSSQEASTSSVVKLGQLIVILKRQIFSRLRALVERCTQTRATVLTRRGSELIRAAGALANLHVQASGIRAIWQWTLVREEMAEDLKGLNEEVRAALDVLPEQAKLLAQASLAAVTEISSRLHSRPNAPLPLWSVTTVLDAIVQVLEQPSVKMHLVDDTKDLLTPLGAELVARTVDVAYDLMRFTTLSSLPPHEQDPVQRLRLQEEIDGEFYGHSRGSGSEKVESESERAERTRINGMTLLTLHRLGLLTKESSNVLSPRSVGNLLHPYGGRDEKLPLFLRLSLNAVVSNVAPLVMTDMQHYALCCNPETCKPSSRIVSFLEELQQSGGEDMRNDLLQDDLVAQGLVHRIRIIGFRNTSERALGLLWTWLTDMIDMRENQPTRESKEATVVLGLRALTSILSMIDPNTHTSIIPPYLEVEKTLSSYLETVAGLYLHRVHMMQRFDFLSTHNDAWRALGRSLTDNSPADIAVCVCVRERERRGGEGDHAAPYTDTHTHPQTHTHRHRHTHTHRHRHTPTDTDTHAQTQTHTHTQTHTRTHDTHTDTHTDRHTHRQTHTHTREAR